MRNYQFFDNTARPTQTDAYIAKPKLKLGPFDSLKKGRKKLKIGAGQNFRGYKLSDQEMDKIHEFHKYY